MKNVYDQLGKLAFQVLLDLPVPEEPNRRSWPKSRPSTYGSRGLAIQKH